MTTFQLLDPFLCHLCKKNPAQARFDQSLQTWCQNVALDIVYHMRLQKMDNMHEKRAILASTDEKTAKNRHFVSKKKRAAQMLVAIAHVLISRMCSCIAHFKGLSFYFQTILKKFGFLKILWCCDAPFPDGPK